MLSFRARAEVPNRPASNRPKRRRGFRSRVDQPTQQDLGRAALAGRSWAYASTTVSSHTPIANRAAPALPRTPPRPSPQADRAGAQITDWAR